jgi:hypothetical protein
MYQSWNSFLDIPELIDNLKYNYEYWKHLEKTGIKDAQFVTSYIAEKPFVPSTRKI